MREITNNECNGMAGRSYFIWCISPYIIAIYIGKLLNSTTKVVDKAYKIIDYNERHIHETNRKCGIYN